MKAVPAAAIAEAIAEASVEAGEVRSIRVQFFSCARFLGMISIPARRVPRIRISSYGHGTIHQLVTVAISPITPPARMPNLRFDRTKLHAFMGLFNGDDLGCGTIGCWWLDGVELSA
ncbi:MAG: hypothetical protein ACR2PG_15790 [Hyphomicrobiaceae bacterium]